MSLLTRLWDAVEQSTAPTTLAVPEPAPEVSAITKEESTMHTADQAALASIFTDLYAKLDAATASNSALASRVTELEAITSTLTPTFDTSLVSGYSAPVQADPATPPA